MVGKGGLVVVYGGWGMMGNMGSYVREGVDYVDVGG